VHEPAHDVGLLGLAEAAEAVVHADQDDLSLRREAEVHAQVVPPLLDLVAVLLVSIGDELGLPVPDQDDVAVLNRLVLLLGVLHTQHELLRQQCRELGALDQPSCGLRERLLACKVGAVFPGYEELHVAGICEVVLREPHLPPDVVALEVCQVAEAFQVLLAVRRHEVEIHGLALLVELRRLLQFLIGEDVQLLQQRSDMVGGL